jgi:vacuolar protein sorting-associated protein 26
MDIIIDEIPGRKKMTVREKNGEAVKLSTFYDRESIAGKVIINLNKVKKLEHQGIKIELLGLIEHYQDKKNLSRFITLAKDLEPAGFLTSEITNFNFNFNKVDKQLETYRGNNMMVRYLLRVTLSIKMRTLTFDQEFGVINPQALSSLNDKNNSEIRLEVGIEDWLHLIFEVDRSKFHLKDCISGQVTFKKVSIRLKSMELQIIKRETITVGNVVDNDTITKFEIMDGAPIKSKFIGK